jgi:hypothetical protein
MTDALSVSRIHRIHKPYVDIAHAEDHLRLGWMVLPPRPDWRQRPESVHLVWLCRCKLVVPV